MKTIEVLDALSKYAVDYHLNANKSIQRNKHMNNHTGNEIPQNDVDALLVDFINFIGTRLCVDYAMYTSDLTNT